MYTDLYFFSIVFLLFSYRSYGQEIAESQCGKYSNEYNRLQAQELKPNLSSRFDDLIGGTKSAEEEFPFMAAIGYGEDKHIYWECGGALISEKFILTAAHCAYHRELGPISLVRLGTVDLKVPIGQAPALDIKVKKIQVHPQYAPPSVYNDLALVELDTKVNFTKSVFPACLHNDYRLIDAQVMALGWGRLEFAGEKSDWLMKVTLFVSHPEVCRSKYSSQRKLRNGINSDTQICAGGEGRDTCQGDSGGPLQMKSGNKRIIVGITSFGDPCGITNSPGVYTRVSTFVPWLEKIVW